MIDDPRDAKDLDEASRNPDGTYNGLRALSWLSRALTGGKGIPLEEVEQIAAEAKAKAQEKAK
ncbi:MULTISPECIES: hypothetical protein [unclassified Pseudomonas]|uniref:hypothetical protein n=1 Tax=unclassified Pseudomonas TaxID=196821 RepID=UPI000C88C0DD|nr:MULTISPECIES: hypothetical protein [unclassified Pseudomonas]PMX29244.1 hypothetical protein C1Y23_01465 [Pseudomonas sp. GW460-12]PMX36899.1 hypothetical protein C1Y24_04455 [Pseudomonas sp. MPR-R2A4]PMX43295.1 hypothetical protein C1Y26_03325 [Pseudomonas sp. MPR-R2A7]PMX53304.1 hypothetical protein C1Y17_14160 [Pseudomonas sp. MPR-R2A6]PMX93420.1 hypothetical protein C1Y21_02870 [Pseudomonas sp. MPR-R2A3]